MIHAEDQDGSTLIEVLVSLALLSVLAVYALSAFRVQKDMEHISSGIARKIEVRAALNVLRHQLQGMQLVFTPGRTDIRNLVFEGHRNSITFAGLSDGSRIEGGLYRITFFVGGNQALVAKFEPINASGFGAATSIVVLENATSLEFAYGTNARTTSLVAEWVSKDSLPLTIDATLMVQGDNQKQAYESKAVVELAQ